MDTALWVVNILKFSKIFEKCQYYGFRTPIIAPMCAKFGMDEWTFDRLYQT